MLELACDDVVFHFNKKHLEDNTIPMWIVKTKGESYYVEHVDCQKGWSTKETPDNSHTKGSIKIKDCKLVINDENTAIITHLTEEDKIRLANKGKTAVRVITSYGNHLKTNLTQLNIEHGVIKMYGGGCSTLWYVVDILDKEHVTMLFLLMGDKIRVLKENETYYRYYDEYSDYTTYDEYEDDYDDDDD